MSETPRTDEAEFVRFNDYAQVEESLVYADFARTLEQELITAFRERNEALGASILAWQRADKADAELSAAREQVAELQAELAIRIPDSGKLAGALIALRECKLLIPPAQWPEYAQQVLDLAAMSAQGPT